MGWGRGEGERDGVREWGRVGLEAAAKVQVSARRGEGESYRL